MQVPASPDARVDQSTGIWIPKCLIRGRPHYFTARRNSPTVARDSDRRSLGHVVLYLEDRPGMRQVCASGEVILASFINRLGVFQLD
jgi:hypothetical protein